MVMEYRKRKKRSRNTGIRRVPQVPKTKLLQRSIAPVEDMEASSSLSPSSTIDLKFFSNGGYLSSSFSILSFCLFS